MKTNDLRTTVLILGGTLLIAFVSSSWWVSRQAQALREIHEKTAVAKEELALSTLKRDHMEADLVQLHAFTEAIERKVYSQPAKYPKASLMRAKVGFNDIQHHVAKGDFQGLSLTDGYMELKAIFDNPAFEDMLASDHGPLAP
jgi:hypothetical protein